jgi:hypothetical protein
LLLLLPREEIYDLLRPNSASLNLREDIRKGVYVEGLVEKVVDNSECCCCCCACSIDGNRMLAAGCRSQALA